MKKVLIILMLLFNGLMLPHITSASGRVVEEAVAEVVFAEEEPDGESEVGIIGRIGLVFALLSLVIMGTITGILLQKNDEFQH